MNAARDLFANLCFPESNFGIIEGGVDSFRHSCIMRLCLEAGGKRRWEVTHWKSSNYCSGVVREGSLTPNSQ